MRIAALDFEATDKDPATALALELGLVIYDTALKVPLEIYNSLIRPPALELAGYVSPTGIRGEWLQEFGKSLPEVFGEAQRIMCKASVECILAHNCHKYDRPLALNELKRHNIVGHAFEELIWVDSRIHVPYRENIGAKSLTNVAAEHLILNYFPHRALFDSMTMCKVIDNYSFEEIFANAKIPQITIRALTGYDDREKAKAAKFFWSGEPKKIWIKEIPETAFALEEAAAAAAGFRIARL